MAAYIPNFTNPKLVKYVEENIKPLYEAESTGHDWNHITNVMINMSKLREMVEDTSLDDGTFHPDKCYLAVVYHDISLCYPGNSRETHEIDSGELFQTDQFIRDNVHPDAIKVIADAIYKHRASTGRDHKTTLSKLLYQADRGFLTMTPEDVFKRSKAFHEARAYKTHDTYIETTLRAIAHMKNKYGENGYAYNTIYFQDGVLDFRHNMEQFLYTCILLFGEDQIDRYK